MQNSPFKSEPKSTHTTPDPRQMLQQTKTWGGSRPTKTGIPKIQPNISTILGSSKNYIRKTSHHHLSHSTQNCKTIDKRIHAPQHNRFIQKPSHPKTTISSNHHFISAVDSFSNFFLSAQGIASLGTRGPFMTIFFQSSVNLQLVDDR